MEDNNPKPSGEIDYELSDDYADQVEISEVQLDGSSTLMKKNKTAKKVNRKGAQKKKNILWIARIFIITLVLSAVFLVITETVAQKKNIVLSIIILVLLLTINIGFDMIGTAAASADIEPFISKASRKNKSGKTAVKLLKNAEKVTSFCNDVVGDICGIVSGGCASAVVLILVTGNSTQTFIISVVFSAVISSLTVGGKAIGKLIGMKRSHEIIMAVSKALSIFTFEKTKGKLVKKKKYRRNSDKKALESKEKRIKKESKNKED